jgi:hypothetical protein
VSDVNIIKVDDPYNGGFPVCDKNDGGFDYKLEQRRLDNWPDIEAQRVLWAARRSKNRRL